MFRRSLHRLLPPILLGLASLGPPGCAVTSPPVSPDRILTEHIDALLPGSLFPPSGAGVHIVSVSTGKVLYERNPDLLFPPASCQKLFTSAAALMLLGPRHTFTTEVLADTGEHPALILLGGGDPLFSTGDLDSLVPAIVAAISPRQEWILAGTVGAFDDLPFGRGWMWDDEPDPGAVSITPLCLDGNTVKLAIGPGYAVGDPLRLEVEHPADFVAIVNEGITVRDSVRRPPAIRRRFPDDSNRLIVSGEMRIGDPAVARRISVRHPERRLLHLLAERLQKQGVTITETRVDTTAPAGFLLAARTRTLDSVLVAMNRTSDNLAAECVFRTLGRIQTGGRGSGEGGARAVTGALAERGIDTAGVVIADGSGVSRYNLASARALSGLLAAMARDTALFPLFLESLPLAGRSGTLAGRMRGTAAEGNVRAKTGSMAGVSALSGYARTADGELLAFSILMGHFAGGAAPYRAVQDALCAVLASVRR